MGQSLRDVVERTAKGARDEAVDDRLVSPLANEVGGCATLVFIVLFTALGVAAAIAVGRMGGDADAVGPVAIGVGLLGGMVLGAPDGKRGEPAAAQTVDPLRWVGRGKIDARHRR